MYVLYIMYNVHSMYICISEIILIIYSLAIHMLDKYIMNNIYIYVDILQKYVYVYVLLI